MGCSGCGGTPRTIGFTFVDRSLFGFTTGVRPVGWYVGKSGGGGCLTATRKSCKVVNPLGKKFDLRTSLTIFIPSDSALLFWRTVRR